MYVSGAGEVVLARSKRNNSMIVSHGNITNTYGNIRGWVFERPWLIEQREPSSGHLIYRIMV